KQPFVQLDCIPADWPALEAFEAGIRAAGLVVRRFRQFGNWYEPVFGKSWDEYLASRPGNLRELLRRRQRNMAALDISFEIIRREKDVARGIVAYETIYDRSWKPAEPFPRFNPELMRLAARLGLLRLGLCWRNQKPIAAQFWVVAHGNAIVMKLAHDETERSLSPGTLLTATMIEHLLPPRSWRPDVNRRPRALIISPRFLFPLDEGGKIRTVNILRHMKDGPFELLLAGPAPNNASAFAAEIAKVCDNFIGWPAPNRSVGRRLISLAGPLPVSVATDDSAVGRALVAYHIKNSADLLIADFPHTSLLLPGLLT